MARQTRRISRGAIFELSSSDRDLPAEVNSGGSSLVQNRRRTDRFGAHFTAETRLVGAFRQRLFHFCLWHISFCYRW